MQETSVQKIAGLLKVLVNITLVCNLVALPVVPPLVYWRENPFLLAGNLSLTGDLFSFWLEGVSKVWSAPYTLMLALFLLFSGCCTAVVLWQGRRVLNTILRGEPFSMENAVSLKRAAVCAFCIAVAALVRVVFSVCLSGSPAPLLTYNALFVPIFAMAGLLCLIMSALFRQAAEIKAENDLTI